LKTAVRVLVACGGGMATSVLAADTIKEICLTEGINCQITFCNLLEIPLAIDDVDIVFVTNNYKGELGKPLMNVFGLISGIDEDEIRLEIVTALHQLANEKK
jgi:PTS system galactitol-specific IIB component